MQAQNRRRETRTELRIPLRFRPLGSLDMPEQQAESENVSQFGVYFTTDFPLTVGCVLVLWMKLPAKLLKGEPREARCIARVVRAEPTGRLVRQLGVGLRIEQCEFGARAERWVS
ncbi:MAG: PilZ domain-containing protein [Candidatus Acidiferrales bacterium]|jgi:hypothetical protein